MWLPKNSPYVFEIEFEIFEPKIENYAVQTFYKTVHCGLGFPKGPETQ
jgi:hypothetical protein